MTVADSAAPLAFRCASGSRDRQDPQLGSAPQARRWLLIEHRGPWQIDALAGAKIDPEMLALILSTAATSGARPLLIRRPGRAGASRDRAWAVSYDSGVTQWGTWRTDDDLATAVAALAAPTPSPGAVADPVILVCAHGLHDACCAIRGRPVAAALAAQWPDGTWECSHVGGDRFAANVVMLPDGVYYGLLEPDTAVQTVQAHLRGEVLLTHLRGMTRVSPPGQVAIAAVHERFGPLGGRAVNVTSLTHTPAGVWEVELAVADAPVGPIRVSVVGTRRAAAQLTCRAGVATPAMEYHVVSVVGG